MPSCKTCKRPPTTPLRYSSRSRSHETTMECNQALCPALKASLPGLLFGLSPNDHDCNRPSVPLEYRWAEKFLAMSGRCASAQVMPQFPECPLGGGRRERGTLAPALLVIWRKGLATVDSFRRFYELSRPAVARAKLVRTRATKSEPLIGVVGRSSVVYGKLNASACRLELTGSAVI